MIRNKKIFSIFILFILLTPCLPAQAATANLAKQYSGRILLQTQSFGRAWYIYPKNLKRYYLKDGQTAYQIMRGLGLGITDADLKKIPVKKGDFADRKLVNRLSGQILLQVQQNGEAWYVNPLDGLRYYLKDGEAAYKLMKEFSLGVKNETLENISINSEQIVADYAFNDVAHVRYDGENFSGQYFADTILPLASLSKLMTALVVLDKNPDWQKIVTITPEEIKYPKIYVDDDPTSEVDFSAGDQVSIYDLWVALLVSSSNQAAGILADNFGGQADFIKEMNEKAKLLGLTKTIFYDVAGLDSHCVATPKDLAKLAFAAFSQPRISDTTVIQDYTIHAIDQNGLAKEIKAINRNYSLFKYQPEGVKTGYLTEAQRVVALKKGEKIIVVMHALSMNQRNKIIEKLLK